MARLIQSDVRHQCNLPMWHCSVCMEDYCGDEPKFCPSCGVQFTEVKRKAEE